MFSKFVAQQLRQPSGFWGRFFLPWWWNRLNPPLNNLAFDRLTLTPTDRVLEVGFGGGYLLGRMSAVVTVGLVAGVDASPSMVTFCQKRYRPLIAAGKIDLQCAPAEALPYSAAHFNKAISVNSIFYWSDTRQALAEFWRVLAADGLFVICFTSKQSMQKRDFARQQEVVLYEADEVSRMMAAAGFKDISSTQAEDKHRKFWLLTGHK